MNIKPTEAGPPQHRPGSDLSGHGGNQTSRHRRQQGAGQAAEPDQGEGADAGVPIMELLSTVAGDTGV